LSAHREKGLKLGVRNAGRNGAGTSERGKQQFERRGGHHKLKKCGALQG